MIRSLKAETMRELIITLEEGLRFIWKMDGMTGIQATVLAEVMRALDHVLVGVNSRGSSGDEEENGQRTRGKRRRRPATTMRRRTTMTTTTMTTTTTATMTIKTTTTTPPPPPTTKTTATTTVVTIRIDTAGNRWRQKTRCKDEGKALVVMVMQETQAMQATQACFNQALK